MFLGSGGAMSKRQEKIAKNIAEIYLEVARHVAGDFIVRPKR